MFTWICPQCGREVPPSYDECPDCKERAAQQAQAQPPPPGAFEPPPQGGYAPPPPAGAPPYQAPPQQQQYQPPAPPPQYQPPPPQYQTGPQPPQYQAQAQYQPPSQYQPPPQYQAPPQVYVRPYQPPPPPASGRGLPPWLLTVLVALAVLGVVAGIVWTIGYFQSRPQTKPSASVESPAAKPGAAANAYQKYIEISGVRFGDDPKHKDKTLVHFIVTNHSDAGIDGLGGNVTVWGSTRKSEEDAQGTFTFKTDIKPMESKELTEPLNTKLKIYELPDWQNVTTDVQITSPAAQ